MNSTIYGLLAETSLHPGSGKEVGFVDLPVAREEATDYPVIVGSSLKGALLDMSRSTQPGDAPRLETIFGKQDYGGDLIVGDARILLHPVRSLSSHFKWVTCPHLIERYCRDRTFAGMNLPAQFVLNIPCSQYLGAGDGELFLEERHFSKHGDLPEGLVALIEPLIIHSAVRARLPGQIVVLNDDDYVWFARYGLAVNARNVLDNVKKTSKNLWYEETIPPDTLFYSLIAERTDSGHSLAFLDKLFMNRPYLQVGGNASVGQGWVAVSKLIPAALNENGGQHGNT